MKKLLIVGSSTVHTGNFCRLVSQDFDEILLITDGDHATLEDIPREHAGFSLRSPLRIGKNIKKIRSIVARFRPDIIHVQQAGTEAWLVLRAVKGMKIPVIVTAWGSDVLVSPGRGLFYRRMLNYILAHADALTCDSYHVAAKMQEFSGNRSLDITLANFGINIEHLGLPKERIIYSNRLHKPLYNLDLILKAFKASLDRGYFSGWKLVMAGEGEETGRLQGLAKELGIDGLVDFPGWLDRETNSAFYEKASIFVSIPSSDATAISLLEAMASGCIPVLSNLPANHEWVIDGYNGIIATDLQSNFLERALLLEQKKTAVINAEIITGKGTRDANRLRFLELYERILSR